MCGRNNEAWTEYVQKEDYMYFSEADMTKPREAAGATNYPIFDDGTAPCAGCNASVNFYVCIEYPVHGVHDDNEGFYVVKGTGTAKVGDEEQAIHPGSFFYAPAHVHHAIKKDAESEPMQVVLFHFPA